MTEDFDHLTKLLDRTKSGVFIGSTSAFLAPIMCSLKFRWDRSLSTAGTDGINLIWNPDYFLGLPIEARKTDLKHELWHVGKLHGPRRGNRCPTYWNVACDIHIDLGLEAEGCSFEGIDGVLNWPGLDPYQYVGWVEEDIYDDLQKRGFFPKPNQRQDIIELAQGDLPKVLNTVVKAMQQAKMAGAGCMPGDIETMITKFLTPIVPWQMYLHRFMQELVQGGYTWKRPNRRHNHVGMYLPSVHEEEGALAHLAYIEDTSGSISDADSLRFNSEFKYVKDEYKPNKMTLVQFDRIIQDERTYGPDDPFEQVKVKGRGGTSLVCVHEWIVKHRPTAVVIFSDLECAPMQPLPFEVPVIWIAIRNKQATVPFGQLIHIN